MIEKSEDGYVFFEYKFTNHPNDDEIIREEIKQVNQTTLKPVQYGFASKSGFKRRNNYPYFFLTLQERYQH